MTPIKIKLVTVRAQLPVRQDLGVPGRWRCAEEGRLQVKRDGESPAVANASRGVKAGISVRHCKDEHLLKLTLG